MLHRAWNVVERTRLLGQLAALAIAVVFVIDPVVRIDVFRRNAISLLKEAYENEPGRDLFRRRRFRHIRVIAHEFDADRVGLHNVAIGLRIVDVFVVVPVGAVAVVVIAVSGVAQ